jgi:hypothetical protein
MANTPGTAYAGTNQTGTAVANVASSSHNVTAGWSAVCICRSGDNVTHTRPTYSSGTDDVFTQVGSTIGSSGNDYISMWYCASVSAHTSATLRANFGTNIAYDSVLVGYWSGGATTSPLSFNASGGPTDSATSITNSGTWTSAAGDLVITAMSYGNSGRTISAGAIAGTTGTRWITSDGSTSGDTGMAYRVVDAGGSRTGAMSISGAENGLCIIVAGFKVAAGSGLTFTGTDDLGDYADAAPKLQRGLLVPSLTDNLNA